jgi:hypothetical protein
LIFSIYNSSLALNNFRLNFKTMSQDLTFKVEDKLNIGLFKIKLDNSLVVKSIRLSWLGFYQIWSFFVSNVGPLKMKIWLFWIDSEQIIPSQRFMSWLVRFKISRIYLIQFGYLFRAKANPIKPMFNRKSSFSSCHVSEYKIYLNDFFKKKKGKGHMILNKLKLE